MPHLDASALSMDVEGLEFLSKVLETPKDFAIPRRAFEIVAPRHPVDIIADVEVNRPRRLESIPEAA